MRRAPASAGALFLKGIFEAVATDATVLTERESYIVAQALYEFIRLEQSKTRDLRRCAGQTRTTP